jgi:preprotein translocase subunit SecA
VTQVTMLVQVKDESDVEAVEKPAELENVQYQHADFNGSPDAEAEANAETDSTDSRPVPFEREGMKIGRNDMCPCGSGKKYKQCHGKLN